MLIWLRQWEIFLSMGIFLSWETVFDTWHLHICELSTFLYSYIDFPNHIVVSLYILWHFFDEFSNLLLYVFTICLVISYLRGFPLDTSSSSTFFDISPFICSKPFSLYNLFLKNLSNIPFIVLYFWCTIFILVQ